MTQEVIRPEPFKKLGQVRDEDEAERPSRGLSLIGDGDWDGAIGTEPEARYMFVCARRLIPHSLARWAQ